MMKDSTAFLLLYCFTTLLAALTSGTAITEAPQSTVVLLGAEPAVFHCSGSGILVAWLVDDISAVHDNITQRGVDIHTSILASGLLQSTIIVPSTSVSNGSNFQCLIINQQGQVLCSPTANLTVLPGVGNVSNLVFTPSTGSVSWSPPWTAQYLSNISYQITVTNTVTDEVVVNITTTNTRYLLPRCQPFTTSVTALYEDHHGGTVDVDSEPLPGENYRIQQVSTIISITSAVENAVHPLFKVKLKADSPNICSGQRLIVSTHEIKRPDDIMSHPIMTIHENSQELTVEYNVNKPIERKTFYIGTFTFIDSGNELGTHFSTFNIQSCTLSNRKTVISIICQFAINSSSTGFVVLHSNNGDVYNTTLKQQVNSTARAVVITDLLPAQYNVTVYDSEHDYRKNSGLFAYPPFGMKKKTLYIIEQPLTSLLSTSYMETTPTAVHKVPTITFAVSTSAVVFIFIVSVAAFLLVCVIIIRRKFITRNNVTITVEENLAYMTMKKMDIADNSAYASHTFHQSNHIYDEVL